MTMEELIDWEKRIKRALNVEVNYVRACQNMAQRHTYGLQRSMLMGNYFFVGTRRLANVKAEIRKRQRAKK